MFRNAKINDRVFDYTLQKFGKIIKISSHLVCPIKVSFDNNNDIRIYTFEGLLNTKEVVPMLFWNEVDPIIPPNKPLPDLKVDTKVIVWEDNCYQERKYFSHFKDSKIYCFINGATSWTTADTIYWNNWKLVDESEKG